MEAALLSHSRGSLHNGYPPTIISPFSPDLTLPRACTGTALCSLVCYFLPHSCHVC